jgi:hypothetical protein
MLKPPEGPAFFCWPRPRYNMAMDKSDTHNNPEGTALRCWPWSHRWSFWVLKFPESDHQRRRCVRCGKISQTHVSS